MAVDPELKGSIERSSLSDLVVSLVKILEMLVSGLQPLEFYLVNKPDIRIV